MAKQPKAPERQPRGKQSKTETIALGWMSGDGQVTVGKALAGYLGTRRADHAAHGFRPVPPRAGLPSK